MSDDRRPSITRTRPNSLFPQSSPLWVDPFPDRGSGRRAGGGTFGTPTSGRRSNGGTFGNGNGGGSWPSGTRGPVSPIGGRRPYSSDSATPYQQAADRRSGGGTFGPTEAEELEAALEEGVTTQVSLPEGFDAAGNPSIFAPLGDVDPNTLFLFDRGAPINPETGDRTGVLESRGVYSGHPSDVLMERAGDGPIDNENMMTLSAGILWLRNLAARDRTAYNDLVVLLRNAGYGTLPDDDRLLPLNGYTQQVGVAFALAANDLAAANAGGDNRTLLEYLTERGQGYEDYIAQKEADEAPPPVERRYQDPATLRAAAKQAAVQALGRKLTDDEEARFEAAFRSQEDSFYDAIDSAAQNETAFSGFAPDVTGQVDAFLDGPEFDTERAANNIGENAQVFMRMMGLG